MLRLLINSMLYYVIEDGEMEPNGKLFLEKLEGQEDQNENQR